MDQRLRDQIGRKLLTQFFFSSLLNSCFVELSSRALLVVAMNIIVLIFRHTEEVNDYKMVGL